MNMSHTDIMDIKEVPFDHIMEAENFLVSEKTSVAYNLRSERKIFVTKDHPSKGKLFFCDVCNREFDREKRFIDHTRIHTGKKPFACDFCGKKFAMQRSFKEHLDRHDPEKAVSCVICKKKFTVQKSLNEHLRIHTGEKPYQCEICPKSFTHRRGLSQHKQVHTGIKPFACNTCEMKFTEKRYLKRHFLKHHTETEKKTFSCEVCSKKFTHGRGLAQHSRVHFGVKPFACKTCDREFVDKRWLDQHFLNFHSEVVPVFTKHSNISYTEENIVSSESEKKLDAVKDVSFVENRTFMCQLCNKEYSNEDVISKHVCDI